MVSYDLANIDKIIKQLKAETVELYGNRLSNLVIYGSWARNEATEDSDIDVAIVLKGPVQPCKEIDRLIDIITDINLKYNVLLSVYPVSEDNYKSIKSPLLLNIRKEGVPA
jgi:predicted nucleotidyltransferase